MVFTILGGVYHTQMIETFSNLNSRVVCMVHTMVGSIIVMVGLHHSCWKHGFVLYVAEFNCYICIIVH